MSIYRSLYIAFFVPIILFTFIAANNKKEVVSTFRNSLKTTQMRVFTINKGKMDVFLDAWRKGVYPLRIQNGFKIEGAWIAQDKNKLLWILSYDGPEGFAAKDSTYYPSTSRKSMEPDPAQYIAEAEYYFLNEAIQH